MKQYGWILAILMLASPAWAAKRVTVDQLEKVLNAAQGKTDAELARHLSDMELTERLSSSRLARWQAALPDDQTRQALVALADQSQFLALPASEIPSTTAPDFAAQRQIMHQVFAYVSKSIPQLPNMFASRVTSSFEDTPLLQKPDASIVPYKPLHFIGSSSETMHYRDGQEAVETGAVKESRPEGLKTWGVFGPILGTVLEDAARSKLTWSHWEPGAGAPLAVFSYAVPKEKSHYKVDFCCVAEEAATQAANLHSFDQIVAYHGEIAVDPASGTILRLMLVAELKPDDPVSNAAIMVEYGPVEIGGKTYFCPVKSVSKTVSQTLQFDTRYLYPLAHQLQPLKTMLNDAVFEQYHLFRAETRILAENEANGSSMLAAANPADAGKLSPEATAANTVVAADSAQAPPAASTAEAVPASQSATASGAEIREDDAKGPPKVPLNAGQPMAPGFTIRSVARLVDVGLVAYDKKGHPIKDLKQDDFEVYDNGRKQQVRFFSQFASEAAPAPSTAEPSGRLPRRIELHVARQV